MKKIYINIVALTPFLLYLTYLFNAIGGSSYGPIIYLVILLIGIVSLLYIISFRRYFRLPAISTFLIFFILLSLTFMLSKHEINGWKYEAIGTVYPYKEFMKYATFICSFFIGFNLGLSKYINHKYWVIIGVTFWLVSILCYYIYSNILSIKFSSDYQNNTAYLLVSTLPFIPLYFKYIKNKIFPITILLITSGLIISSSKRGAIVCLLISLIISAIIYIRSNKLNYKKCLILIISICGLIAFIYYYISTNEYLLTRLSRMEEGEVGARSIAYPTLFNHWYHSSFKEFFLGDGLCNSVAVWGNFAHNDWLELLLSNGLVGVIIYAGLFISIFISIKGITTDQYVKLSLILCIAIWLIKSIFSMGYSDTNNCMLVLLLGALISKSTYKS